MSVNYDKIQFISQNPIDKIVQSGSLSIVNPGNSSNAYIGKLTTTSVTNNYGKSCLVRIKWRISGITDWLGLEAMPMYEYSSSYTGGPTIYESAQYGQVTVSSDDNYINFNTINLSHSNLVDGSFTAISRTFEIQYWAYEKD